jgi:hypothetical protein
MLQQKRHHAVALRRKAQAAIFESLPNRVGVHLDLDYV